MGLKAASHSFRLCLNHHHLKYQIKNQNSKLLFVENATRPRKIVLANGADDNLISKLTKILEN